MRPGTRDAIAFERRLALLALLHLRPQTRAQLQAALAARALIHPAYRDADPATVGTIERAIRDGQQLELTYRASQDGQARRHTVEPRPLVYKHGHVYLPVYNVVTHKRFELRLDNIVPGSARVLPQRA